MIARKTLSRCYTPLKIAVENQAIDGHLISSASSETTDVSEHETVASMTEYSPATVGQQFRLSPSLNLTDDGNNIWTFENLTPDVCTVDDEGNTTYKKAGTGRVRICRQSVLGEVLACVNHEFDQGPVADATTVEYELFEYEEGSLAKHLIDSIDPHLSGSVDILESPNKRNSSLWCAHLHEQLTCLSIWNSNAGNRKAGTLVTPRHIVFAAHFEMPVGTTVRFLSANNVQYDRTITHRVRHPDYSPYFPDLTIGLLNEDLPPDILPCKVLPAINDYLPALLTPVVPHKFGGGRFPVIVTNQDKRACIADWVGNPYSFGTTGYIQPLPGIRESFYQQLRSGDSGCPVFAVINGELACLALHTYPTSGTFLTPELINELIGLVDTAAGIQTEYEAELIDLSNFNNYG